MHQSDNSPEDAANYGTLGVAIQKIYDVIEQAKSPAQPADGTSAGQTGDTEAPSEGKDEVQDTRDECMSDFGDDELMDSRSRWRSFSVHLVRQRVKLITATSSVLHVRRCLMDAAQASIQFSCYIS